MSQNRPQRTRRWSLRSAVAGVALTLATSAIAVGGADTAGAIVSGETAPATPWQVSLQNDDGHFCGGSVVDATTIVTAAHCLEGESPSGTIVRAGVTSVSDNSGQDRMAASFTLYPSYAETGQGDIAIIKLAEPLDLGRGVQSIALATDADVAAATTATTTGWGVTDEQNGALPDELRIASVPLVGDDACNLALGADGPTEVCAGGTGPDSCSGDSGGPLVIQTDAGPRLAGVTSWGDVCGGANPGVYADVPAFTNFIRTGDAPGAEAIEGDESAPSQLVDPDLDDLSPEDAAMLDELDSMTDEEYANYVDDLTDAEYEEYEDFLDRVFGALDSLEDAPFDSTDHDEELDEYLTSLSDEEFDAFVDALSDDEFDALFGPIEWDATDPYIDDDESYWDDEDADWDDDEFYWDDEDADWDDDEFYWDDADEFYWDDDDWGDDW